MRDELVEGVRGAGELLAGVAVAIKIISFKFTSSNKSSL